MGRYKEHTACELTCNLNARLPRATPESTAEVLVTKLKLTVFIRNRSDVTHKDSVKSNSHCTKKVVWRNEKLSLLKWNTSYHPTIKLAFHSQCIQKFWEIHWHFCQCDSNEEVVRSDISFLLKLEILWLVSGLTVTPHWVKLKRGYVKPYNPFSKCNTAPARDNLWRQAFSYRLDHSFGRRGEVVHLRDNFGNQTY